MNNPTIFYPEPAQCVFRARDILKHKLFEDFFDFYPYLTPDDVVHFATLVDFLYGKELTIEKNTADFENALTFLKHLVRDVPVLTVKEHNLETCTGFEMTLKTDT